MVNPNDLAALAALEQFVNSRRELWREICEPVLDHDGVPTGDIRIVRRVYRGTFERSDTNKEPL